MNIRLDISENKTFTAIIEHKGDSVHLSLQYYSSTKNKDLDYNPFIEISKYISTLPEENQDYLFSLYKELDNLKLNYNYFDILVIQPIITKIYNSIDLEKLKLWLMWHCQHIYIPSDLTVDFVQDEEGNTSLEKTYLRDDYVDLLAMIVKLRLIIPVMADFLYINRKDEIRKAYKEHYIMGLLSDTDFEYTDPYVRLVNYFDNLIKDASRQKVREIMVIENGISNNEITKWMVSQLIFIRFMLSKISRTGGTSEPDNIVKNIYNFIRSKTNGLEQQSNGQQGIRVKNDPTSKDEEGPNSICESYKKATELSFGAVTEIQVYLDNPDSIFKSLIPEPSEEDRFTYTVMINNVGNLLDKPQGDLQTILLGWILGPIFDPRMLAYVERKQFVGLIAVAQSWCFKNELPLFAHLLGSYHWIHDTRVSVKTKNKLSKESMSTLDKLFPEYNSVLDESGKTKMELLVYKVADMISNHTWISMLPDTYCEKEGYRNKNVEANIDIFNDIVNLLDTIYQA